MNETAQHRIRILVAESVDLVRMGLRMLFENHPIISLAGETNDIEDLPGLAARHRPDVILMDIGFGNDRCAEHVSRLMTICAHSKILFFSPFHLDDPQCYTLPPGVSGVISKYSPCKQLITAIYAIYAIHSDRHCADTANPILLSTPQSSEQTVIASSLPSEISASFHPDLSNNERRVAYLAGKGLSAREISQQLLLTEKTVRNYLSAIYKKIGVKKQVELCLRASIHNHFQD